MIKSLGKYEFESRSRQELYGDDMLIHVLRADSMFFCSAMALRVPRAMKWGEFVDGMVIPWASSDPDFDASKALTWKLVDDDFTPDAGASLEDNGIKHKNTVTLIGA